MGANRLEAHRQLVRKPELDNSDFGFACYLGRHNWDQKTTKIAESMWFYNKDGKLIALAFYNNQACTYKVHGLEEVEDVYYSNTEDGS